MFALAVLFQVAMTQSVEGASTFYIASMDLTIDAGAQDFVVSSIQDARATGATTVVLVINTFGGNGLNMDHIISAISDYESSGNTFITLIAPAGSHSFSAGAFIAEASTKIYMVSGTAIGSATPVLPPLSDPTELRKDINAFATFMETLAGSFGRNETAASLMVTEGKSYTDIEAASLQVVDGALPGGSLSVRGALAALPPPYSVPDADTITIHTPGARSLAISILSDPNLSGVLFLLGVFAILADLYHPTLILSVIGATAIALALFGLGVFGASFVSLALMLIGAAFIFLEIKTHHGVSASIGVVIFIIGFLLIFRLPPAAAPPDQPTGSFNPVGILTYLILGLIGSVVVLGSIYLYSVREKIMRAPPYLNPKAIIGKEGYLTTDLKAGEFATANISSEDWTVTGSEDMAKGTRVKVTDIQGLRLRVERKEA